MDFLQPYDCLAAPQRILNSIQIERVQFEKLKCQTTHLGPLNLYCTCLFLKRMDRNTIEYEKKRLQN